MAVPFRHQHRVTYAECTVGNHVYHSRYLDVLEAARGEFIRSLGSTVLEWQERDVIFPIIEARLNYKSPARYDDLLTIEVRPTLVSGVRVNFSHRVVNQNGKLLLDAETFHVCTGTVVGETAIIGDHVKLYHGVTLGAKSTAAVEQLRGKKRHPTIEDRVTIYPGATILGGDTIIGAGSTIGGNVFLMESVAPNSVVLYDAPKARVLNKLDRKQKTLVDFQI